jgi:TPR repeat protein
VKQDIREAVKWFIKAARQGDKTAQHNLGVYYATLEPEAAPPADAAATEGEELPPESEATASEGASPER